MTYWEHITDTVAKPKRELDIDQAAAVENCLEDAAAWARGELPLAEALKLVTAVPRAIGLAFQHRWSDPRRPALERLHMIEYGGRTGQVYTNFGWLPTAQFEQVCRNNEWRKQWADDRAA